MIRKIMTCLFTAAIAICSASPVGGDAISSKTRTIYLDLDMSCKAEFDGKVYYAAHRSLDEDVVADDISGQMTENPAYEKNGRTWRYMLSADIPEDYDQIRFSSKSMENTDDISSDFEVSELFTIPENLKEPCLYLDDEDPSIYENAERGGTWQEAGSVRDPEKEAAEKGNALTDIPEKARTESDKIRYLPVNLYDAYSDQELNGIPKSRGGEDGETIRSFAPFRVLDMTLSARYRESGAIPVYTGHFQPDCHGEAPFSKIAPLLDLYGWDDPATFFAVNNSLLDANGEEDPQNYASASQGLVADSLSGDCLMDSSGRNLMPYFDESFLGGANSRNAALGRIYENVAFPFSEVKKENGTSVWSFDSAKDHVHLMKDAEGLYLGDPAQNDDAWSRNVDSSGSPESPTLSDTYGFFPLNDLNARSGKNYNFGFGARIGFDFYLPDDGLLMDDQGKTHPVTFSFSGDDDVWVFIDGKLALDVGGDHGKVEGDLDFHDLTAHVSSVKQCRPDQNVKRGPQTTSFAMDTQKGKLHRLTMYYLERGMWESNLKIEYSLSPKPFEPTPELTESSTPELIETPTPRVTEELTPTPTEIPIPESTKEPIPDPTEEPEVVPTEIPESVGTPSPEPTDNPAPEQPEDSIPTKPDKIPVPESENESVPEEGDKPIPEAEEDPESVDAEPEPADSVREASSETESIEEVASVPAIPKTDTPKKQPFTAGAGGKSTKEQMPQPTTTKTSAVKTGDVPLKAIIIPILSGLLTLYAYLRRRHKGKKR